MKFQTKEKKSLLKDLVKGAGKGGPGFIGPEDPRGRQRYPIFAPDSMPAAKPKGFIGPQESNSDYFSRKVKEKKDAWEKATGRKAPLENWKRQPKQRKALEQFKRTPKAPGYTGPRGDFDVSGFWIPDNPTMNYIPKRPLRNPTMNVLEKGDRIRPQLKSI